MTAAPIADEPRIEKIRSMAVDVSPMSLDSFGQLIIGDLGVLERLGRWYVTNIRAEVRAETGPFKQRLAAELYAVEIAHAWAKDGRLSVAFHSSGIFAAFDAHAETLGRQAVLQ